MKTLFLPALVFVLISGCSLLQKTHSTTPTITITGPPEIQLKDLNLVEVLQYIDSLNKSRLDSAGVVIWDLKDELNEQKREYEERIESMQNNWDKEKALQLDQSKAFKKPK